MLKESPVGNAPYKQKQGSPDPGKSMEAYSELEQLYTIFFLDKQRNESFSIKNKVLWDDISSSISAEFKSRNLSCAVKFYNDGQESWSYLTGIIMLVQRDSKVFFKQDQHELFEVKGPIINLTLYPNSIS